MSSWGRLFVMNTEAEDLLAYDDYSHDQVVGNVAMGLLHDSLNTFVPLYSIPWLQQTNIEPR